VYQTLGGAPHLDQNYTVFGEVVKGLEVVDKIAGTKTTGREGADKPITDIRIVEAKLVRRSKN
jgi:peptidyl-prolyl cis-trans isomerase B (cyclophilin B)